MSIQFSFAQFIFRYGSDITGLEEVESLPYETSKIIRSASGSSEHTLDAYYSKCYKTSKGDTITVNPTIAIIVEDTNVLDSVIPQFEDKLSFKKKIGKAFLYNCDVKNSDEVLKLTSLISRYKNIIGCEAMANVKVELSNARYHKQYYLHNSSSSSLSINAEPAWSIASGLGGNITVAVIDGGVDHNHEDLPNVLDGYTLGNKAGKGDPVSNLILYNSHGTACAGIIGAANNSIGVRGIASNVKILPVNIFVYDDNEINFEGISDAIKWAADRADVLSCSWGWNGTTSGTVAEAVQYALTQGRNGKGCVVAFSCGNSYPTYQAIKFPASEPGVISVGAVDKTGNIWDYSQRGNGICLVAPSGNGSSTSDIVTTDRMGNLGYTGENYTEKFGGTSAACPQVAGVAALILSMRPDLTSAEVKELLQGTAKDLGPTGYDTTYGYGLVDAFAAVKEALLSIKGANVAKTSSTYSLDNKITTSLSDATVTWSVEDADQGKLKLTTSGYGNNSCTVALNGTKTVSTQLTAVVKVGNLTIATLTKNITLLGTFSGTYSVPATTINGVSMPAIVNRPFTANANLEARSGVTVTINSDDLKHYVASWSGSRIENWTVGTDFLRFSYPTNASSSSSTILRFTSGVGGTAQLMVHIIQPGSVMYLSHTGEMLRVTIVKEEREYTTQYDSQEDGDVYDRKCNIGTSGEDIAELSMIEQSEDTWTIEVTNALTGAKVVEVTTTMGEYQFNTSLWVAGLYVVRATNGIQTITKKITIN